MTMQEIYLKWLDETSKIIGRDWYNTENKLDDFDQLTERAKVDLLAAHIAGGQE